jgi:hypothetical protein
MPDFLPPTEVFVSDASMNAAVLREIKRNKLRKLASRLYTRNLTAPPQQLVSRNLWFIVAAYMPGALIADRSALDYGAAPDGSVFVVSGHKRDIELPGAILRPRKGPPPLDSDPAFIGGLRISSPARAYLENMRPSRARRGIARTLTRHEIEERLDEMARQGGEPALLQLRDQARKVAGELGMAEEFRQLDGLIGTLLGTRDTPLVPAVAAARAGVMAYDPQRLELSRPSTPNSPDRPPSPARREQAIHPSSPSSKPTSRISSKAPSSPSTKPWMSSSTAAFHRPAPKTRTMSWAPGRSSRTPAKCPGFRAPPAN